MKKFFPAVAPFLSLILSACATLPAERCALADRMALQAGFEKTLVASGPFVLTTYHRLKKNGEPIHVYIEGDGYAWVTPTRISANPTPRTPLVLSLAAEDSAANIVYLARPCQYTPENLNPGWDARYWAGGRFSEPVIKSMNHAITVFVEKTRAQGVHLTGYSGGAAVAVLIAARRHDVQSLRTVAGNLDARPLKESLDPLECADKIKNIPMRHFIGTKDEIIPLSVAQLFAERAGDPSHQSVTEVPGATHSQGWLERWQELLLLPLYQTSR